MKVRFVLVFVVWILFTTTNIGLAQSRSIALRGTLITANGVIPHGWILVEGGRIKSINSATAPIDPGVAVLDTRGIVSPGFVDLHNHPLYAVFPHWDPHRYFANRYEWRALPEYKKLIGSPAYQMQMDDQTFCDMDKFGETEALMGGTTSILGISARRSPVPIPRCIIGLDRNLDWYSGFYKPEKIGAERIVSEIDVDAIDDAKAQRIEQDLKRDTLDLFVIHLGEGVPSDPRSVGEFDKLRAKGLLTSKTAIVHGTAFGETQFIAMHSAGAYLIWSPRSNVDLYGVTTDVLTAMKSGVTVALSPDWAPTGSRNMLEELNFASQLSQSRMGSAISDKQLFEMATVIPARMARIQDKVGSLAPGLSADLFVISGDLNDPYKAVAHAHPQDVQLVIVGGEVRYADPGFLAILGGGTDFEYLPVCDSVRFGSDRLRDASRRLQTRLLHERTHLSPWVSCPAQ
jgi:5-methylthioadenosine/S-adenosylhomocysteine deaminase